jgi:chromosome partitioning protein
MIHSYASSASGARVIVVANEKGGSGKSTVAIHIAVGLMRAGHSVATIDLDSRQRSFTHYINNRLLWSRHSGRDLPTPVHICFDKDGQIAASQVEAAAREAFINVLDNQAYTHDFVVIDTTGHDTYLTRLAHAAADTLITPLNDSFVDLDVLANVDPQTFAISGTSHYARLVEEARRERQSQGKPQTDWIVLRNRLSVAPTRNKRFVGEALRELSGQLGFRLLDGLAERLIFREFYPRGLTAADTLDLETLGVRPALSHLTAQLEVQNLLDAILRGAHTEIIQRADAA